MVCWPVLKKAWPLLERLNKKNGAAFSKTIRSIVNKRKDLPKDARHDFFSVVATDDSTTDEGLKASDLWAEAVFILPAGTQNLSSREILSFPSGTFYTQRSGFVTWRIKTLYVSAILS
jgi:cytochrome P450